MNTLLHRLILPLLVALILAGPVRADVVEYFFEPGRMSHSFFIEEIPASGFTTGHEVLGYVNDSGSGGARGLVRLVDPESGHAFRLWDLTTGDSLDLPWPGAGRDLLGIIPWTFASTPRVYFLVSSYLRREHTFALVQPDGSTYPATASFPTTDWGLETFGEVSATYDPAQPFRLVDLTTSETAGSGETVLGEWSWQPNTAAVPLIPVVLYLEGREDGHRFTVHSRVSGGPVIKQSVQAQGGYSAAWPAINGGWTYGTAWSWFEVPAGSSAMTFAVGRGMEFWITREADSPPIASPHFLADDSSGAPIAWPLYGVFPDPPQRPAGNIGNVTFRINAQRWGHTFTVWQSDGYRFRFGFNEYGAADWQGQAYTTETIINWNDQGLYNPVELITFTAAIDTTFAWWLVDEGQYGNNSETFPALQADVFDGWIPQHTAPPADADLTISIRLPASLLSSQFRLQGASGEVGYYSGYPLPSVETETIAGLDNLPGFELQSFTLTFANPTPYVDASFTLEGGWDGSNSFSHTVTAGMNDLRLSFRPPQPLVLNISDSRWEHELLIRHPDGTTFGIQKGQTQGFTTYDETQQAWVTSYYYFDASAVYNPEMPWYVEDGSTGERTGPNPTNDTLITWFALPKPTGLTGAVNPATGEITLEWPLGSAAVGGGFEVERQLSGEMLWQTIGTLPADTADTGNVLRFSDPNPVAGKAHYYRVRYTYGAGSDFRHSAPSNLVALYEWRDTDDDGMPDWWERQYGLNPLDPRDASTPVLPGDLTPLDKYKNGGDPTTKDTDGDDVNDVDDAYLTDNRRSRVLPLIRYVAVDISTAAIGSKDVWSVAVDDSHQVGFAWNEVDEEEYKTAVWRNGAVLRTARLPFQHKPPSTEFTKTYPPDTQQPDIELLVMETWWYEPKMVNANGALGGMRAAAASLYRKAALGEDVGGLVPPDPNYPAYIKRLGNDRVGNGRLNWAGTPPPPATFDQNGLFYTDLHGDLGLGITNSGVCWGFSGDDVSYSFIGDTFFGVTAGIRPFDFGISNPPENISGNGNAVGVTLMGEDWTPTPAAWLNTAESFFTVFANDTTATYLGINDSAEIIGFSDSFSAGAWFPHKDETVLHAFWYSDGSPSDFYSELPDGFGSHIAFTAVPGSRPILSSNGDMMFSAEIADFDARGAKTWRPGTLLWNRQNQTLSEVEIPGFASFGSNPKMTNAHVMAGLQWKVSLDQYGNEDYSQLPYRAAVLLLPVEVEIPKLTPEGADSNKMVGAAGLNIAKWESAYEVRDDGVNIVPTVKDTFIDLDVDRFVVRVPCLASVGGAQPIVKLSTVHSNGTVNDDATELNMKPDPAAPGVLISDSQILVSDAGDDAYALNGAGTDNHKGDRTHMAGLYGSVRVGLTIGDQTISLDWPVPARLQVKMVFVQAVILRDRPASTGGQPVATEAFVRTDITRRVNERFAQANIVVLPNTSITIMDPPSGITLTDGLPSGGSGVVPLLGAVDQARTSNDIHVIYINHFRTSDEPLGTVTAGEAFPAGNGRTIDSVIICKDVYNDCLTAHELGHILTKDGHVGRERFYGLPSTNLMVKGNDGDTSQAVFGKRLWRWQIKKMRNNSHVH